MMILTKDGLTGYSPDARARESGDYEERIRQRNTANEITMRTLTK